MIAASDEEEDGDEDLEEEIRACRPVTAALQGLPIKKWLRPGAQYRAASRTHCIDLI